MRVNTPQISHQTIDGEVVIINLDNGCYYSLLDLSAALWQFVAAGRTPDEIAAAVAAAYPETADAATQALAFVEQLRAEGLVVDGDPAAPGPVPALPASWAAPLLEKFTDMQELLMLDPIHEVDAAGWPHKPAGS